MTTLISTMSFLRITACRKLLNLRAWTTESLPCTSTALMSSTSNQPSHAEDNLNIDDHDMTILEMEETAESDEAYNVSGLSSQQYHLYHGKPPVMLYKDLSRRRKLYARYGSTSGEDPRLLWPSKQELSVMIEDDKSEELTLHEKLANLQAERDLAARERSQRHKMIEKNMAQMSKWVAEYKAGIRAAEDEVKVKQEKREALLDEARDYFGYKVRGNDPKFQQMIEEKEAQEKKEAKERRKKEKAKKAAERLKKDVILMGLNPEEDKTS